ncbi:MAG: DNA polymerase III subunit gamma/tau [Anaerococcus sp.]|nr:DNA polymerase III subunit gamma/tau [Anaerococcus sp.]
MAKALYRQYRPRTFDQLLGQDRVVNVLKNQVKNKNFSHAYIFAGERGTGKTTSAKIFAKAINCLNPQDGSPCLECENCRAIDEESTIDIVEMDAASNRRIDDIRNLKDNVIYPPNKLKYKVYIIDEAHMITREAFNALLKIMEEPPSHLVFILATTELEKIPSTILSRVQKFEFNKIDGAYIKKQIELILNDKEISMESEAIDLIIRKAKGAMRDALSILDQVISSTSKSYSLAQVENLLGSVDFYDIDKLTQAIFSYDQKGSLDKVFSLRESNKSNKDLMDSLTNYLRDIMIFSMAKDKSIFENKERAGFIEERSMEIDLDRLLDMLDTISDYSIRLKNSDNTDLIVELMVLRLINTKNIKSIESRINQLENNHPQNIGEIVNKLVEEKLKTLNFDNLTRDQSAGDEKKPREPEKEIKDQAIKKVENPPSHRPNKEETRDITKNISEDDSLDLRDFQIADIKEMFIKTAGRMLKGMFEKEGFNYTCDNSTFTIYLKDEFYKIFIQTKIDEIKEYLEKIIGKPIDFRIDEYQNLQKKTLKTKNKAKVTEDENNLQNQDQSSINTEENIKKLEDIFDEMLIIE